MDREQIKKRLSQAVERLLIVFKWTLFSVVTGLLLGVIGALFARGLSWVTGFRLSHPQILFVLPVGAVLIRLLYRVSQNEKDGGTNLVLSAIQTQDDIPLRMAPLIFISTIFSHLVGASVGREGAALQLGGSIGNSIGKLCRLSDTDKKTMIMVGMSGVFSALFGTPIAASVFSMEVVSVGIMHYAALLPCVLASFVARAVAVRLGAGAELIDLGTIPAFTWDGALRIALLSMLCGLVATLFCLSLRHGGKLAAKVIPNVYLRAFLLGCILLILSLLVGDQTYNGAGMDHIHQCIEGNCRPFGFLIKILFTVLSISAGYKGGEIVPSFFIGASFGSLFGVLAGFSPALCTACGMAGVFCGVTNCPISTFLICCELFGFEAAPYYLLAIAFAYLLSGYSSLYSTQIIVYSKYKSNFINRFTK